MVARAPNRKRRLLVPEVIQTSLMDCGPAALKAVLQGFEIEINYEWLRERCQTDVDGTSIDALAALGNEVGLETAEIVVPQDSFLLPESDCLPAIVVRRGAGGLFHFVVVWRTVGPFVQVMDPAAGRQWLRKERLLEDMPYLRIPLSIERWRRWMASEDSLRTLRAKMARLGLHESQVRSLLARCDADPGWRAYATLDAAIRMQRTLVEGGAVAKGREAAALLEEVFTRALAGEEDTWDAIPRGFWWATRGATPGKLLVHGAVIVHFARREAGATAVLANDGDRAPRLSVRAPREEAEEAATPHSYRESARELEGDGERPAAREREWRGTVIPDALKRELAATNVSPLKLMWQMLHFDSPRALALVATALVASVVVAAADALILRGLFDVTRYVTLGYQRALGMAVLIAFVVGGFLLEYFIATATHRLGLALEMRLRVGFLEKLPRLEDRYLRSRPTSDMTARGHAMHVLRDAPALGARIARALLSFVVTVAGLVWLHPRGAKLAILASLLALVVPYLLRRPLLESTMRQRTHGAALERFYLDALLGAVPIRVHGAERSVRREHESLLVEWVRTARTVHAQSSAIQAFQSLANTATGVGLVAHYIACDGDPAAILLLVFWALRLPAVGQDLVTALVGYRNVRNVAMRLFAPLGASEAAPSRDVELLPARRGDELPRAGATIALSGVTVCAAGHTLLKDVSLDIPAGSHVAIVGASGAGKSTLVSLLLGWLKAAEGTIAVDGAPLDNDALARLRLETAWIDPAIHLWNRTLYENVVFGNARDDVTGVPRAIERADLTEVLENLPEGLQASLGEGGARVSGGQGQRVRLARALMRESARLVILDEPFRGLERERRRELLRRVRAEWQGATLLFVSHDVRDTFDFDRVLVVHDGRIVEDGPARALLADRGSHYYALARADHDLYERVWSGDMWKRHRMERGRLVGAGGSP